MNLFADFVEPLTRWIYVNPNGALLITFLISLTESLAIIGSIIPGSVTMTAIGILAGTGVMDIPLTLLAAIAGAIAGDMASYALGYIFSDHLADIWPFRRYPKWIQYGKEYFTQHGGKSVVIGRFFGPLRSIIPVIAGMLRMNHWHFLVANIVSAIGWSILYVGPGILIGEASNELSAENATNLFFFILIALILIWLMSQGVTWLFKRANYLWHIALQNIWIWTKRHPAGLKLLNGLMPHYPKKNYYTTSALLLLCILCLLLSVFITLLVAQGTWVQNINHPCFLFLQSLRTQWFDAFFIMMSLIISPLSLIIWAIIVASYAIYNRHWRLLRYWLSINLVCFIIAMTLVAVIDVPKPDNMLNHSITPLYPAINLMVVTALFCFFRRYVIAYYQTTLIKTYNILLIVLLLFAGLSCLYLGDNWVTSILGAYFIGSTIYLTHWILFRRHLNHSSIIQPTKRSIIILYSLWLLTIFLSYPLYFKQSVLNHSPHRKQFIVTNEAWWHQKKALLPIYSTNRIGRRAGLLNIQYAGSLHTFEKTLTDYGWKKQSDSLFHKLIIRAGGKHIDDGLPFTTQLYLNQKPDLVMSYRYKGKKAPCILKLWRSNYHIGHCQQPIWLGNLICSQKKSVMFSNNNALFSPVLLAFKGFHINQIELPKISPDKWSSDKLLQILIIQEPKSADLNRR